MPGKEDWERKLNAVFTEVDHYLEDTYGHLYPLHPARPKRGQTSNVSYDGLFNIGASFSLGIGSEHGEGYVVDVRMVTLSRVPDDVREKIEAEVAEKLDDLLPKHFPNNKLSVERDGNLYKIIGDLGLGSA